MVMVITSPPFLGSHDGLATDAETRERMLNGKLPKTGHLNSSDYGNTPGQIGALKEGNMTLTYTDTKVPTEDWYGCYDGGWQAGHLTDDSFSHPAKMAKGLVYKIVREGLTRGWWTRYDTIIDPFGGIGSTGIACSAYGIASISVELEPRFCRMAAGYDCPGLSAAIDSARPPVEYLREVGRSVIGIERLCPSCQSAIDANPDALDGKPLPSLDSHHYTGNFELHAKAWEAMGYPQPVILQGDSRFLLDVIQQAGGVVTSPPWTEVVAKEDKDWRMPHQSAAHGRNENAASVQAHNYGTTPGQIGAMPAGHVITSPPFSPDGNQPVIGQGTRKDLQKQGRSPDAQNMQTEGNIAAMPINVVTSPPYEKSLSSKTNGIDETKYKYARSALGKHNNVKDPQQYSESPDNLGNTTGNDYESACILVYSQLYQIMTPGGVAAIVVKPFVKKGELVDLPGMTLGWLIDIGFEAVLWINAKVVAPAEQLDMFSELNDVKERKSFFRQLHEKRCVHRSTKAVNGAYQCQLQNVVCNFYKAAKVKPEWAPKDCSLYLNNKMLGLGIDAEVVLIVRKPGKGGGTSVVTSPPYMDAVNQNGEGPGAYGSTSGAFKKANGVYNRRDATPSAGQNSVGYGNTPGQIGKMPAGRLTTDRN